MTRYAVRRILGAIPLLLGIATLVFFVMQLAPGDPALLFLNPNMSAETLAQIRHNMGLDEPVVVRYLNWLAGVFRGDFQMSLARNQPALDVVLERLPNTMLLSGSAIALAFLVGMVVGIVQAVRHHSLLDSALSVVALFFYSMPSFWLALMMVLVFSLLANAWHWPIWFPSSGAVGPNHDLLSAVGQLKDRLMHLVLPASSLALVLSAGVARYTRGSMLDVIGQDYVRTARAKGLPERVVILKHALRNALLPIITLVGLYLPFVFSGAVLVETVFTWPGMGRLLFEAISQRDYPVVMAGSMVFATMVVIGNLVADLLYAVADPRIRHE